MVATNYIKRAIRINEMDKQADYFEHVADIGVIGRGQTMVDAFLSAAAATFAIMADPSRLSETLVVEIRFNETDNELALVTWLNRLLAEARVHGAVFRRFELERDGSAYAGKAYGCLWEPGIPRGTEVKGATLTELSVRQTGAGWEARCVVDV
jgi:SHS2 domain-containing protein